MIQANHTFDPCAMFPARIKTRKFKAEPITEAERASGRGGATDLINAKAILPTANNAYCRTIRLHEALHAIYTPKPSKERIKSKKPYTCLEQALEDARLHLNCAKTSGTVRRDELATALHDLHGATRKRSGIDSNMAALIALRSAAIITSTNGEAYADVTRCKTPAIAKARASKRLTSLCSKVAPEYREVIYNALDQISRDELAEAKATLAPYFSGDEQPQSFIKAVYFNSKGEDEAKGEFADVSFDKLTGKLGSEAAEMLSKHTADRVREERMPKLHIHQLFARHNIPTFFGATEKHTMSGTKICAKRLATIVGPTPPRLFLKTIRRNGGTVLIDASGSMRITPDMLLKLVNGAPLATIGFYNAPTDSHMTGNLWVYAHKGKRAADFSGIGGRLRGMTDYEIRDTEGKPDKSFNCFGWGNVVDFQALQWLLAMPAPRYILTDGEFTGPYVTRQAASELLNTAIARKKLTQITSYAEMEKVLRKGVEK